ncbi:SGNH/GDSL hydrolase family protein [Azotobacter armeniacus]
MDQKQQHSLIIRIILVLLVAIAGYFWGGLTVYKQIFPYEQMKLAINQVLVKTGEARPRNTLFQVFSPQADVVMIGDSITEAAPWDEIFPQIKIANRGIGGDRADDILKRMEPIFAVSPKKAFLMVGINDIYAGLSVAAIFENYTNIVSQLQGKRIKVYIQSTIECSESRCGNRLYKVRELNDKLKAFAAKNDITFININSGLSTERGGLLPQYTYDGMHLLGSGYLKWSETISPYVKSN